MLAVVKTGGKQYLIAPQTIIKTEKINGEVGQKINFNQILLFSDGERVVIGKPFLANFEATAEILKQARERKKIVFRYHNKTRYRKMKGHRQEYSQLKILDIKSSFTDS